MTVWRGVWLVLVPLLLGAASASSPDGSVHVILQDASNVVFEIDVVFEGGEGQFLRRQMDADGDGHVTGGEQDAYGQSGMRHVEHTSIGPPTGRTYLDGMSPSSVRVDALAYTGAVGSVEEASTVHQSWRLRMVFPSNATETQHLLQLDLGNRSRAGFVQARVTSLTVSSPPGFVINGTGGFPLRSFVTEDRLRVVAPTPIGTSGTLEVLFSPAPATEARDASAPAVGGLVLLGAVLWRRWAW